MLWLWRRLAAVARIGPLAWEPPYAASGALKSKKQTNKKPNNKTPTKNQIMSHTFLGPLNRLTYSSSSLTSPFFVHHFQPLGFLLRTLIIINLNLMQCLCRDHSLVLCFNHFLHVFNSCLFLSSENFNDNLSKVFSHQS